MNTDTCGTCFLRHGHQCRLNPPVAVSCIQWLGEAVKYRFDYTPVTPETPACSHHTKPLKIKGED